MTTGLEVGLFITAHCNEDKVKASWLYAHQTTRTNGFGAETPSGPYEALGNVCTQHPLQLPGQRSPGSVQCSSVPPSNEQRPETTQGLPAADQLFSVVCALTTLLES